MTLLAAVLLIVVGLVFIVGSLHRRVPFLVAIIGCVLGGLYIWCGTALVV